MLKRNDLKLSPSRAMEVELIESIIARQRTQDGVVRVLEAGCGRQWPLRLEGVDYHLTGVDMDAEALAIRKDQLNDLDEIIVGDLRAVDIQYSQFDVIYNAYVLEHIRGAEGVLQSFVHWLRPNGVIILRIPDPESVHGFITKFSPHWVHIFYYRYILGNKRAGSAGYPPYPTVYDPIVSRVGLRLFCERNCLTMELELGDGYWRPGRGMMKNVIDIGKKLISFLSFGRLSHRHTDLLYVLRKCKV